ncbi:hypothetical protein AAE478_000313 [Parahypoxylon ruwenzoriense]
MTMNQLLQNNNKSVENPVRGRFSLRENLTPDRVPQLSQAERRSPYSSITMDSPNPHHGKFSGEQNITSHMPPMMPPMAPMHTTAPPMLPSVLPSYNDWLDGLGSAGFMVPMPPMFSHQEPHAPNMSLDVPNFQDPTQMNNADHHAFFDPLNIPNILNYQPMPHGVNIFNTPPQIPSILGSPTTATNNAAELNAFAGDEANSDLSDQEDDQHYHQQQVSTRRPTGHHAHRPKGKYGPPFKPRAVTSDMAEKDRDAIMAWNNQVAKAKRDWNRQLNRESAQRSRQAKQVRLAAAEAQVKSLTEQNTELRAVGQQTVNENGQLRRAYIELSAHNAVLETRLAEIEKQFGLPPTLTQTAVSSQNQSQSPGQGQAQAPPQTNASSSSQIQGGLIYARSAPQTARASPAVNNPLGLPAQGQQQQIRRQGGDTREIEDDWQLFIGLSPEVHSKESTVSDPTQIRHQ